MKYLDFEYRVERSDRKTLAISVLPDGSVMVRAPLKTPPEEVERTLAKRISWIHGQRDYFAAFNPRTTPRHYVAGETHYYLGKTYRLRLRGGEEAVRIQEERLVVFTHDSSPASVEKAIAAWYRKEAKLLFARLFLKCWARFQYVDAEKPKVVIKKMRKRWGSLSSGGILTLNPDLVRASESCAEYVICHELCHQEFPNHSADFYKKLESVMPDWEKRKQRLELTMK